MSSFLRKALSFIILISLTGCGAQTDAPFTPAPDLSHTDPTAVKAILEEDITGEFVLNINGYHDSFNNLLNEAAKVFEAKYPNVDVKIKNFKPETILKIYSVDDDLREERIKPPDEAQTRLDYLSRINTELMGGNGADILLIDVIPWFRYADMGYLEDLRVYMDTDADFNKEDLRMNIIDAAEYRGGVYALPISFTFSFFAYDAALFNDGEKELLSAKDAFTFSELIALAGNAFDRNTVDAHMFGLTGGKYNDYNIFRCLLEENYASFVDLANKKARFDDGRFEKLLLSVTDYIKKDYIQQESEMNDLYQTGDVYALLNYGGGTWYNYNPNARFLYKYERYTFLIAHFDKEFAGLSGCEPTYGNDDNDVIAGMAADFNGNINFRQRYMYAINSNSKNKRAAWEFIKLLLSEEIQSKSVTNAFPVNRNALEAHQTISQLIVLGFRKSPLNDDNRQAWNDYLEYADKLMDTINAYTFHDDRIDQWIEEEVTLYFNGEKSAKDVAEALQNKVNLYLNE